MHMQCRELEKSQPKIPILKKTTGLWPLWVITLWLWWSLLYCSKVFVLNLLSRAWLPTLEETNSRPPIGNQYTYSIIKKIKTIISEDFCIGVFHNFTFTISVAEPKLFIFGSGSATLFTILRTEYGWVGGFLAGSRTRGRVNNTYNQPSDADPVELLYGSGSRIRKSSIQIRIRI